MKTLWAILALWMILIFLDGTRLVAQEPVVNRYRVALMELGALPVETLQGDMEHKILGMNKGMKVDYRGWLSPMDVLQSRVFSTERCQELQLPSSKQEIIDRCLRLRSYLDLDKYLAEKDPLHLVLMHFLLEIMDREKIPPNDLSQLMNIFKAGIGLEAETASLLHGRVNWRQAGELYRVTRNRYALYLMPKANVQETGYISWLKESWTDDELDSYDRWYFLDLLVRAQPKEWLEQFYAFTRNQLDAIRKNNDIGGRLIEIGTAQALDLVAELLATKSSPQDQAIILYNLIVHHICSERILGAVLDMADNLEHVSPEPRSNGFDSCEVLKTIRVYLESLDLKANNSPQFQRAAKVSTRLDKFLTPEFAIVIFPLGELAKEDALVESHAKKADTPYDVIVNRLPLRKKIEPQLEWSAMSPGNLLFDFQLVISSEGQALRVERFNKNNVQQGDSLDSAYRMIADTLSRWEFEPLVLAGRATTASIFLRIRVQPDRKQIMIDNEFPVGNLLPGGLKRFPCDPALFIRITIPEYPLTYSLKKATEVKVHCITDIYGRVRETKIDPGSPKELHDLCLKSARNWIIEPYIISGIPKIHSFSLRFLFQPKKYVKQ